MMWPRSSVSLWVFRHTQLEVGASFCCLVRPITAHTRGDKTGRMKPCNNCGVFMLLHHPKCLFEKSWLILFPACLLFKSFSLTFLSRVLINPPNWLIVMVLPGCLLHRWVYVWKRHLGQAQVPQEKSRCLATKNFGMDGRRSRFTIVFHKFGALGQVFKLREGSLLRRASC